MCTALSLDSGDSYFGRTLDLDRSYGEEVCIIPRKYSLCFRKMGNIDTHYAMIGMATVVGGIPLFYDAVNEYGLAMAGLNFPKNAYYSPITEEKDNIAPFEVIQWILGQCKNTAEARELLSRINIADISFSAQLPNSPLHWMISGEGGDIVVEARAEGLYVHENPVGVMTNNPPFEYQLENLEKYRTLRRDNVEVKRETGLPYSSYCQGLGAVGLPGDVSSMSRFVRASFGRKNSSCGEDEAASVGQFFHIMSTVEMVQGVCLTDEGTFDITVYTSCMNKDRGLYYYTTYGNRRISCVDMHSADLDSREISRFSLVAGEDIFYQK